MEHTLNDGMAVIPVRVLKRVDISGTAKLLLVALSSRVGTSPATDEQLCDMCDCTGHDLDVAFNELSEAGLYPGLYTTPNHDRRS